MRNEYFFQIEITHEQVQAANMLVAYSIAHHPVTDVFAQDPGGKARQREFRFTGTLGEIVFADVYHLVRPSRSFGAVDGQDFGQDFSLPINGATKSFDIKTMGRKDGNLRTNYVLNLPAYQMNRTEVLTDYYFCISIHKNTADKYFASFLGFVSKQEILENKVGILYKAKTQRIKDNGGTFVFQRDTYEVDFQDITTPMTHDAINKMPGYQLKKLLLPFK